MLITGTLINASAVIIGSTAGILLHSHMPAKANKIVFQSNGLFTLFLGISMALKTHNFLILIFSILLGTLAGEWMHLDNKIDHFGEFLKEKIKSKNERFSEGLVMSFLMFCMGSMTILGAFEEGLGGKPNLLLSKSVLDGFGSVALASVFGIGVLFSVVPLLIYQGGLTLFASSLGNLLSNSAIDEMSAVGGLLLLGLGLTLLDIKKMKVVNMLPALLVAILLDYIVKLL
ncbi:MAG: DUF554 domain-containing protein [Bacteroidota bacterium]|nr:DUF554 domain-containing protein [Bacteroidota bacterium]